MFESITPSVDDQFGDSFVTATGMPDDVRAEMDAAFGYGTDADDLTEDELEELHQQYLAGKRAEDTAALMGIGSAFQVA